LELVEKLKHKSAYEVLFENSEKNDLQKLLTLSSSQVQQIGLQKGIFKKIHASIEKMKAFEQLKSAASPNADIGFIYNTILIR
jgi:pyridoxine 5'-phosphate synthase PdxJ